MSKFNTSSIESKRGASKTKSKVASRKIRAVLATGLGFGVGVSFTLAAWNDSEYAKGAFTAGKFDLQGSVASGIWGENPIGTPAELAFTIPALNLSPDAVTYAPYAVRLSSATTSGAAVTMLSHATTGTITNLTYTLVKTASFACDADIVATAIQSGNALVTDKELNYAIPVTQTFNLEMGSPAAATPLAGVAQHLCFAVKAGANLVQGQTGTSTISFTASSTS